MAGKKKNCFGRKFFQRKKCWVSGSEQAVYGHLHTLNLSGRLCYVVSTSPFPIYSKVFVIIFPVVSFLSNICNNSFFWKLNGSYLSALPKEVNYFIRHSSDCYLLHVTGVPFGVNISIESTFFCRVDKNRTSFQWPNILRTDCNIPDLKNFSQLYCTVIFWNEKFPFLSFNINILFRSANHQLNKKRRDGMIVFNRLFMNFLY